jgi:hypothetical protein
LASTSAEAVPENANDSAVADIKPIASRLEDIFDSPLFEKTPIEHGRKTGQGPQPCPKHANTLNEWLRPN